MTEPTETHHDIARSIYVWCKETTYASVEVGRELLDEAAHALARALRGERCDD